MGILDVSPRSIVNKVIDVSPRKVWQFGAKVVNNRKNSSKVAELEKKVDDLSALIESLTKK